MLYKEYLGIQIHHGDCRDIIPTLPAVQSRSVDLLFTDPPYEIQHTHGGGVANDTMYNRGQLEEIGVGKFEVEDYSDILVHTTDSVIIFHSRDQIRAFANLLSDNFKSYDLHIWHKPNPVPFVHNVWLPDVEYIALGYDKSVHKVMDTIQQKSKVWTGKTPTTRIHPTQKPIGVMMKYLMALDPKLVIDPFMGSGTTLMAAKQLGIEAIGIEQNMKWCKVAADRLSQSAMLFGDE